jgi:hypothetical protein
MQIFLCLVVFFLHIKVSWFKKLADKMNIRNLACNNKSSLKQRFDLFFCCPSAKQKRFSLILLYNNKMNDFFCVAFFSVLKVDKLLIINHKNNKNHKTEHKKQLIY